jgi:hypothetical protein
MRIPRFLALLSLATLILSAVSFADTFTFGPTVGDLGTTVTYTADAGAVSLTLWGFSKPISGGPADTHLFLKTGGGDENGMGLANDPTGDDEISGTSFIQFKGTDLTSISVGSVQDTNGETFQLWGSNTFGTLGSTIGPVGTTDGSEALPGGFAFYSLTAPVGNVLLDSVSFAVPTSEPGTTAMILTLGLVGLFEVGRRKLMA